MRQLAQKIWLSVYHRKKKKRNLTSGYYRTNGQMRSEAPYMEHLQPTTVG